MPGGWETSNRVKEKMTMKKAVARCFTMQVGELAVAIGAVYRAASSDQRGAYLRSVHIEREGASLRFVATNGCWMAVYTALTANDPLGGWEATLDLNDA